MSRAKRFLTRHIFLVGLLSAALPCLIIFGLQYRSLVALHKSLPIARKEWMRSYLVNIVSSVEDYYQKNVDRVLSVPPSAFERNSQGRAKLSDAVRHFEENRVEGGRRLFIGYAWEEDNKNTYSVVLFYKPDSEMKLVREPGTPDWRAAHGGADLWLLHSLTNTIPQSASLTVDERDPANRVIVKPIIDPSSGKVVGVAGMIVDETYLKEHVVLSAVDKTIAHYFPTDYQMAVITLRDSNGDQIMATGPSKLTRDEVSVPMQFVFKDWRLGMLMSDMTEEQWAERFFSFNLSLSVLMTALLIGGIVMALRTASRELKLSQMKADFVSNVSHELRTPLASIRVFGEFMKLGRVKEPEKIREYGEYIETESRRLTQLINNILDFSKIESGKKTYRFERADVSEVVSGTLKAFEVRLAQTGFVIDFSQPAKAVPKAVIDPDAIAQAVTNLLDNAVKYSADSRNITIRLGYLDGDISISVTDHGVGIPREERDKIFEKFHRVSTGLVHDVKGSGLGLSIVKHIVEAHNGRVTVESRLGEGSTFTIHLPVEPTQISESEESDPRGISAGLTPIANGK